MGYHFATKSLENRCLHHHFLGRGQLYVGIVTLDPVDIPLQTSQIDNITEGGVRMSDGKEIDADILVTATGLELELMGGTQFSIDGDAIEARSRVHVCHA